jgi:predicted nuclease of predicted toxin-antitoxin system
MKIKLDENLPDGLSRLLVARGHDAQTVPQQRLGGAKDLTVWDAALYARDASRVTPGALANSLSSRPA